MSTYSQALVCSSTSMSSGGSVVWQLSTALALSLIVGCQPVKQPLVPSASQWASLPAPAGDDVAQLSAFAINAFVVPVLENDSDPPRFTDVQLALSCAEETDIYVDGSLLVAGDSVPAGAFVLQWNAKGYCPFGRDGPVFDGRVDVLVFRDDERGMSAVVRPARLHVAKLTSRG